MNHRPLVDAYQFDDMVPLDYVPEPDWCAECGEKWPCPTFLQEEKS